MVNKIETCRIEKILTREFQMPGDILNMKNLAPKESKMDHTDLMKGIGLGLVAGGIIGIAMTSRGRKRRKCKNHTIRAVGDVVGNVTDMLGL